MKAQIKCFFTFTKQNSFECLDKYENFPYETCVDLKNESVVH